MQPTAPRSAMSKELRQFLAPPEDAPLPTTGNSGHGVWGPGIRMMRNMQFVAKGSLIGVLFLIPMTWLAWALFAQIADQVAFSSKEQLGVQYNRTVFPVMALAQQLRRESSESEASAAAGASDLKAKLAAANVKLSAVQKELGVEMGSAKAYADVQKALSEAEQAKSGDAAFNAYSACIASLITLVEHVTDASNLTLDPDIDSYYVMDAALFRMPTIMESANKLRDLGLAGMKAGSFTATQKRVLTETVAMADFQLGSLVAGLGKATAYNASLASKVNAREAIDSTAAFFAMARRAVIEGDEVSADAQAAYLGAANKALAAQQALTLPILNALDEVIGLRVSAMQTKRLQSIVVLTLALLLALYFFYSFFLVTRGGLKLISKHLDEMSHGDLRHCPREPWGTDEPAHVIRDLRKCYESLYELIRKVRHSARALHGASGEIAAASADLGSRTEHAAAELEQQASAMEEIGSTVNSTADLATMAATFAVENAGVAERGGEVFAEVVSTMRDIHTSSSRINDIISVIDGIAFQTNILALNAAVEAARAGESGRGFAVVASEVRSLAQRSASAAREIKALISASVDKVDGGTRIVEAAGQTMGDVVANARQINQFLSEISVAAREQATGVSEVGRSIQELDKSTQQNAALVEETMAAAAALTSQADELQSEVANFRVA